MRKLLGKNAAVTFFELCEAAAHTGLFIIFSSNELVCVLGASGEHDWVFQSVQTGKNSQDVVFFFSFLCRPLIQFYSSREGGWKEKKTLYVQHHMNEGCFALWTIALKTVASFDCIFFLTSGTHFEFWFVLNTVFLALLLDHVNVKTSK